MKAEDNVIKRSLTNNTISWVFCFLIFFLNVSSILIEVCCELFQVVADVAAFAEELTNSFVKEGFEVYGRQTKGTKIVDLINFFEHQKSVLGELQKELVDLNAMMIERKNQRQH